MDEKRLDRMETKIDKLIDMQSEQNAVLAQQNIINGQNTDDIKALKLRLSPIEQTNTVILAVVKGAGILATVLTIVLAIIKLNAH